jgi:enediyne biosynthesis protein E4
MRKTILALATLALLLGCSGSDAQNDANVTDTTHDMNGTTEVTPVDIAVEVTPDLLADLPAEIASSYPPEQCKQLSSPWSDKPLYLERSANYALDEDHLDVLGNRLAAVDLDGDFYPELIVHKGGSHNRDDPAAGIFERRILANRPTDAGRTFEDVTVESNYGVIPGTADLGRAAHFAVFADVDNDGDLDAFSGTHCDKNSETKVPDRSIILLNDGTGRFEPAPTSDISPEEEWSTSAAAFIDYDLDGIIDLWEGNWYYQYGYLNGLQDRLYRGNGDGTFTDVTVEAGLATTDSGFDNFTNHRPTFGVTACDIDGDGDGDLLSSSYGRQLNQLFLNLGDGTFLNVADAVGFSADANQDFSDNQFYACYCHAFGGDCDPMPPSPAIQCQSNYWSDNDAKLWRNGGNTFSTVCADVDNDLDLDLYNAEIVHWHIGQSSDPSQILLNDPAQTPYGWAFNRPGREATGLIRPRTGGWNEGDIYAAIFDADSDGWPEIFQPSSDYPDTHGWLFRNLGDGTFEDVDEQFVSGLSLDRIGGITIADFDRDGDLDSVVAFSTMRCDGACEFDKPVVRMYINTLNGRANWSSIRLVGKGAGGANAAGIGARIVITANGLSQVREIGGGYGHMGMQNGLEAHFGLGENCTIEKLEIHWPNADHTVSTFENVPANYFLRVHEATGELEFL